MYPPNNAQPPQQPPQQQTMYQAADGNWYPIQPQPAAAPAYQQQSPPGYAVPSPNYGAPPPNYAAQPPSYPQQQAPWQGAAAAPPWGGAPGGDSLASEFPQGLDFNDPSVVGAGSLPEGDHLIRFDDFEYGESKATPPNPKATVKITIAQGQHANRSGVYSYVLTPKAIFRLGRDLQKLNLGLRPNGARWSTDPRTLCGELTQELRGRTAKIRVTPQIDKDTKMPSAEGYTNTTILGWPTDGAAAPPAQAPAVQQSPPQVQANPAPASVPGPGYVAPSTLGMPPQVTYPQPNGNGQAAFRSV